jgi:hypothetical protein
MLGRLTHLVSCKEASRLLSQREDRALALADRLRLALHLAVCVACSRFERQLAVMRNAIARYRSQDV